MKSIRPKKRRRLARQTVQNAIMRREALAVSVRRCDASQGFPIIPLLDPATDDHTRQFVYQLRVDASGLGLVVSRAGSDQRPTLALPAPVNDVYGMTCVWRVGAAWHELADEQGIVIRRRDVPVLRAPIEIVMRRQMQEQARMNRALLSFVATTLFIAIVGLAAGLAAWTHSADHRASTAEQRISALADQALEASRRAQAAEERVTTVAAQAAQADRRAQAANAAFMREVNARESAQREQRHIRAADEDARRAVVLALQGDVDAAILASDQALNSFHSRSDVNSEIHLLHALADALFRSNAHARAESIYRRLLNSLDSLKPPDLDRSIDARLGLAAACRQQRKILDASKHASEALALAEKWRGGTDVRTIRALRELVALHLEQEQWTQARETLARIVAAAKDSDESLCSDLAQLAGLDVRLGKFTEAEELVERLIERPRDLSAAASSSVKRLSYAFAERGRYDRAIQLLEISRPNDARGAEQWLAGSDSRLLARLYVRCGQYGRAESLYGTLITARERSAGRDDPDLADCAHELAELHERQGKMGQAEALYKLALEIREKVLGPYHLDVARSATALADLYNAQGRKSEADALYALAADIRSKSREAPPLAPLPQK